MAQGPYGSVQKSQLNAILMILMDFTEILNIVSGSECSGRVD